MKTYREIPKALNEPMTILEIPMAVLAITVIAFAVLVMTPLSKIFCAAGALVVFAVSVAVVRYDIRFPRIFLRALTQKALYTPERRDVFRLEIK